MSATVKAESRSHVGRYLLSELVKNERKADGPEISDAMVQKNVEKTWSMINWESIQHLISKDELAQTINTLEKHKVAVLSVQFKGGGFIQKQKSMGIHRPVFVNSKGKIHINFKANFRKKETTVGEGACKRIKFTLVLGQRELLAFAVTKIIFQVDFSTRVVIDKALIKKICKNEETYGKLLQGTPFVVNYLDMFYFVSNKGVEKHGIYMPFYNCGTLRRLHRRGYSRPALIEIFLNTVRGVGAFHDKGLIHRDLKNENILLHQAEGEAKPIPHIIDLGFTTEGSNLLALLEKVGSLGFVAQELWRLYNAQLPEIRSQLLKKITNKVDMYAIGIIFGSIFLRMEPKYNTSTSEVNEHYRVWNEPANKISVEHLIWLLTRDNPDLRPSCKESEIKLLSCE